MGYVTENRIFGDRSNRNCKPSVCGGEASYKTGIAIPGTQHYVTSWRGPIETLRVGSKRRRLFRSFDLKKYDGAAYSKDTFCPPGASQRYTGHDLVYGQFLHGMNSQKHPYPYASYFSGEFPMYWAEDIYDFVEPWRDEVERRLFLKLHEPRWDGAVFFGELGETLTSVRQILMGAVKAFTRAGKIIEITKHFALNSEELWLWYRYFLLPAMLDAQDLLDAIKPQASIDRVQTGMPKTIVRKEGSIFAATLLGHAFPMEIPWKQEFSYRAGGAIDIFKRTDPSEWGTSAVDVLRAGWEVIPFSFVFDWFVELGDFLTTLRNVDVDYAQSYATYAWDSQIIFYPGDNVEMSAKQGIIHQAVVNRKIDLKPPTHPKVNKEYFNVLRTVDAISLTVGIIKNILRGKKSRRR